ncbi:ATP-grasp domain-containing protein, partial [Piscibacillus halophilus]|uniref:ATP-grasp domain-containing protein n=1 Tax=Piscibacillus halophilus TaxID=571933 RepID=UPI001589B45A
MTNNMVWLPHLKNAVPKEAYGYKISMYTIALEGWRRGLKLKFYSKYNKAKDKFLIHYSLSNGKKTHRFVISRGDKVEKEAINICVNKDLTKKYLDNAKVETPKGYVFSEHTTKDDIIAQSSQLGYPLVLKPTAGSVGRGVFSNIQNENELIFAIDYVRDKLGLKEVIVEKYIRGEDYRLYVVDGKVISAFKKIPPNVIGDGESTLLQLIRQKNKMRQKVPSLYNHPIRVDGELKEYIKKYNYKIESVPKKGEVVYLKSKNNVSQGGDPVDMTDKIPYKIKEIAVNATRAIPGLVQCGVDMIIDLEKESGYVIELNSKPGITSHLFPLEGEPRDVPKEIIDFYFPETKNNKINYDYYFDLESVYRPILHGNAKEITLPKIH